MSRIVVPVGTGDGVRVVLCFAGGRLASTYRNGGALDYSLACTPDCERQSPGLWSARSRPHGSANRGGRIAVEQGPGHSGTCHESAGLPTYGCGWSCFGAHCPLAHAPGPGQPHDAAMGGRVPCRGLRRTRVSSTVCRAGCSRYPPVPIGDCSCAGTGGRASHPHVCRVVVGARPIPIWEKPILLLTSSR